MLMVNMNIDTSRRGTAETRARIQKDRIKHVGDGATNGRAMKAFQQRVDGVIVGDVNVSPEAATEASRPTRPTRAATASSPSSSAAATKRR
jgi:hypothetical protein